MKISRKKLEKLIKEELEEAIKIVSADYPDTGLVLELSNSVGLYAAEEAAVASRLDAIESGKKDSELNNLFVSYDCKARYKRSDSDIDSNEYRICDAIVDRRIELKKQKNLPEQIKPGMKITRKILEKIIKEELENLTLTEGPSVSLASIDKKLDQIIKIIAPSVVTFKNKQGEKATKAFYSGEEMQNRKMPAPKAKAPLKVDQLYSND